MNDQNLRSTNHSPCVYIGVVNLSMFLDDISCAKTEFEFAECLNLSKIQIKFGFTCAGYNRRTSIAAAKKRLRDWKSQFLHASSTIELMGVYKHKQAGALERHVLHRYDRFRIKSTKGYRLESMVFNYWEYLSVLLCVEKSGGDGWIYDKTRKMSYQTLLSASGLHLLSTTTEKPWPITGSAMTAHSI